MWYIRVMRPLVAITFVAAFASAGCMHHRAALPPSIPPAPGETRTLFSLREIDVAPGTGALAEARKCLFVHYTGWLTDGKKFDSSRDTMPNGSPRTPLGFPQGFRRVIAGWDLGFEGMRVGGRRRLFIPYQLAYGEAGRLPTIPPKAELIFDVELMAVADTLRRAAPAPSGQTPPAPQCPTWAAASAAK
jgi:peptidylprolyl isomerase